MSETVRVSVYVDKDLSDEADKIFSMLGLTATNALSIFYSSVYNNGEIPFSLEDKKRVKKGVDIDEK